MLKYISLFIICTIITTQSFADIKNIRIKTEPVDALLYIDKEFINRSKTDIYYLNITNTRHTFTVFRRGYNLEERTVDITSTVENSLITFKLSKNDSFIFWDAFDNDIKKLIILLDKGSEVNKKWFLNDTDRENRWKVPAHDFYMETIPIYRAVYLKKYELITLLFKYNAPTRIDYGLVGSSFSVLSIPLENNDFNLFRYMLENGAKLNAGGEHDRTNTDFETAMKNEAYDCMRYLLEMGYDPDYEICYMTHGVGTDICTNLIILAVKKSDITALKLLLQSGADPNQLYHESSMEYDNETEEVNEITIAYSALDYAMRNGNEQIIILLKKYNAKTLVEIQASQEVKQNQNLYVSEISYSSWLTYTKDWYMYHPIKAFDGNPETGWLDGVKGDGKNEYIGINFNDEIIIDEIKIMPGYFDKKWWVANNRIKILDIFVYSKLNQSVYLKDIMKAQSIRFIPEIEFKSIKFIIKEVYRSETSNNTAIAEIEFYYKGNCTDLDVKTHEKYLKKITLKEIKEEEKKRNSYIFTPMAEETWYIEEDKSRPYFNDIAVDNENNIYIAGKGFGLIDAYSGDDWWIRKFNSKGIEDKKNWDKKIEMGEDREGIECIKIDLINNVYISGYSSDRYNSDERYCWIKKYNSDGIEDTEYWNKKYGQEYYERPTYIHTDSINNVFMFGSVNRYGIYGEDWIIRKYSENGIEDKKNWYKIFDGNHQYDNPSSITIDSNNNIFIAGYGRNLINRKSGKDWWIKKFNPNGKEDLTNWNKKIDGGGESNFFGDIIHSIIIDSHDNVFVAGSGYNIVHHSSGYDWWIKKFDNNGIEDTKSWDKKFDRKGDMDEAMSIAVNSRNELIVAGYGKSKFEGSIFWVKRFSNNGVEDTTYMDKRINGVNAEARAVCIDSDDSIFVLGKIDGKWLIKKYYEIK